MTRASSGPGQPAQTFKWKLCLPPLPSLPSPLVQPHPLDPPGPSPRPAPSQSHPTVEAHGAHGAHSNVVHE